MIRHALLTTLLAVTGLVVTPGTAQAQFTSYTTFADFVAGVVDPVLDDFDNASTGFVATPIARTAGPYSYQARTTVSDFFNLDNAGDVWLSVNAPQASIIFDAFSPSVSAFGGSFFATDFDGNVFPQRSVRFFATTTAGSTFEQILTGQTATSFFGLRSDTGPLASIEISVVQSPTSADFGYVSANNVVIAPEPQAWALMATGVFALGVTSARRRRRR